MANIFAILTALVLAVSAFLAWKNTGNAEEEKNGYRGWITARQSEQASLARNETKLADTKQTLADTDADLVDHNGQNETLQTEVDAAIATNTKLKAEKEEKESLATSKKEKVDAAQAEFEEIGDIEQVVADFDKTKKQLDALKIEIEEKQTELASLENQKTQTQASIDGVGEQIKYRVTQESDPSLRTKVAGVYATLGFVTLAAGDNLGVVRDSSLDVLRAGQVVGKLLVTSVEARTAAADIVPDSFEAGDNVHVGDDVVSTPKAAPPQPAGPAVNPDPVG